MVKLCIHADLHPNHSRGIIAMCCYYYKLEHDPKTRRIKQSNLPTCQVQRGAPLQLWQGLGSHARSSCRLSSSDRRTLARTQVDIRIRTFDFFFLSFWISQRPESCVGIRLFGNGAGRLPAGPPQQGAWKLHRHQSGQKVSS